MELVSSLKYTENKGCAGLRSNPAHPLFSGFFHRQCVSHNSLMELPVESDALVVYNEYIENNRSKYALPTFRTIRIESQ